MRERERARARDWSVPLRPGLHFLTRFPDYNSATHSSPAQIYTCYRHTTPSRHSAIAPSRDRGTATRQNTSSGDTCWMARDRPRGSSRTRTDGLPRGFPLGTKQSGYEAKGVSGSHTSTSTSTPPYIFTAWCTIRHRATSFLPNLPEIHKIMHCI
jgi:hypothetical protein